MLRNTTSALAFSMLILDSVVELTYMPELSTSLKAAKGA